MNKPDPKTAEPTIPMWGYWRDKKGVADALSEQYGELLDADAELRWNLNKLRAAEATIDRLMQERGL